MDNKRRMEVRTELLSQGYSAEYMNTWQPKVTLYLHKPLLNSEGVEQFPIGHAFPNQPGHPDHAARKSRLGWLPWLPSETCKCRACRERAGEVVIEPQQEAEVEAEQDGLKFRLQCPFCPFVSESISNLGAHSRLRGHKNRLHVDEAVPA